MQTRHLAAALAGAAAILALPVYSALGSVLDSSAPATVRARSAYRVDHGHHLPGPPDRCQPARQRQLRPPLHRLRWRDRGRPGWLHRHEGRRRRRRRRLRRPPSTSAPASSTVTPAGSRSASVLARPPAPIPCSRRASPSPPCPYALYAREVGSVAIPSRPKARPPAPIPCLKSPRPVPRPRVLPSRPMVATAPAPESAAAPPPSRLTAASRSAGPRRPPSPSPSMPETTPSTAQQRR